MWVNVNKLILKNSSKKISDGAKGKYRTLKNKNMYEGGCNEFNCSNFFVLAKKKLNASLIKFELLSIFCITIKDKK